MSREPLLTLAVAVLGGVLLLVLEPAVGLVVLAGTGAALLLQPRPRTVTAAVLAVVGLGTAAVGGSTERWGTAVAGALVLAAGAVAALRSRRWPAPRRGDRDRGAAPAGDAAADTWAALDRGEDPTA